jgi:hypothetical protein
MVGLSLCLSLQPNKAVRIDNYFRVEAAPKRTGQGVPLG